MKKIFSILLILLILVTGINLLSLPDEDSKYKLDDKLISQVSSTVPNYTKIDRIPEHLKDAVVAVEDRRFEKHYGIDIRGIGRAFLKNIREGEIEEGGSTITQQLAKNLFLSHDRTFIRKLREMLMAFKLETMYSKDEILEMYLNVIYYGAGAYGVQDASRTFFGKDVWELSPAECTMLAGLPQAPSAYNPKKYYDRARKRQQEVLEAMAKSGYSMEEIEDIREEEVVIVR